MSKSQASEVQASFYAAYFVGPLTYAHYVFRRFGFRWTFILGLSLYSVGCLGFVPSARFASFGGFCASIFIIASGFSTVETCIYSYVSICGPPRYAEVRSNLAAGTWASCSLCALMMASYVILAPNQEEHALSAVEALAPIKWVFLGLGSVAMIMAAFCFIRPVIEVTDADMDEQARMTERSTDWVDKPLRKHLPFWLGFAAIFCFCGSQASVATYFINYVSVVKPSWGQAEAARSMAIAQGAFAICRFASGAFMRFTKPRIFLLVSITLTLVCVSSAVGVGGNVGLAMLILEYGAKGTVFPTRYSLALKGLGRHTKRGSLLLVTALAGGAMWVPATGAVADAVGVQIAFSVPVVGISMALGYAIFLNVYRRKQLDGIRACELGLTRTRTSSIVAVADTV